MLNKMKTIIKNHQANEFSFFATRVRERERERLCVIFTGLVVVNAKGLTFWHFKLWTFFSPLQMNKCSVIEPFPEE